MPGLVAPTARVRASFLAAMTEFRAEDRGAAGDTSMIGSEIREHGARWSTADGFDDYLRWLHACRLEDSPRPPGHVPSTALWWVAGTDYLGRIAVRHQLTPSLVEAGGHVGYDIRPSARRRGHATAMLGATLPVAYALRIDPVLITCAADNGGSRAVIERNGGILDDQRGAVLRYWVSTTR